jgi:hypothetical protein
VAPEIPAAEFQQAPAVRDIVELFQMGFAGRDLHRRFAFRKGGKGIGTAFGRAGDAGDFPHGRHSRQQRQKLFAPAGHTGRTRAVVRKKLSERRGKSIVPGMEVMELRDVNHNILQEFFR